LKNDGSHSFTPHTGAVKKTRQLNNVQLTQGQLRLCTQNDKSDKSESDNVEVIKTNFGEIEKEAEEALIQYSHWNDDM
jgi:hypothetical protein